MILKDLDTAQGRTVYIIKRCHDFGDGAPLILTIGNLNVEAQGFLLNLYRFMIFALAVAEFVSKDLVAILTDDILLIVSSKQLSGPVKGGDLAISINCKDAYAQITQQSPQLLVKD